MLCRIFYLYTTPLNITSIIEIFYLPTFLKMLFVMALSLSPRYTYPATMMSLTPLL